MPHFSTTTFYGDLTVRVDVDTLSELHQAVARIQELNREAEYLKERAPCNHVDLRYYVDKEGNEYFGFIDPVSRCNVAFGQYKEKKLVPFFPKGKEGFFMPDADRNGNGAATAQPRAPHEERLDPHDY